MGGPTQMMVGKGSFPIIFSHYPLRPQFPYFQGRLASRAGLLPFSCSPAFYLPASALFSVCGCPSLFFPISVMTIVADFSLTR